MCSTAHVSTQVCGCVCACVPGQEYTFVCTRVCRSVCVQARLEDFTDSDKQPFWVQADPLLASDQKTLRSPQPGVWRSSLFQLCLLSAVGPGQTLLPVWTLVSPYKKLEVGGGDPSFLSLQSTLSQPLSQTLHASFGPFSSLGTEDSKYTTISSTPQWGEF